MRSSPPPGLAVLEGDGCSASDATRGGVSRGGVSRAGVGTTADLERVDGAETAWLGAADPGARAEGGSADASGAAFTGPGQATALRVGEAGRFASTTLGAAAESEARCCPERPRNSVTAAATATPTANTRIEPLPAASGGPLVVAGGASGTGEGSGAFGEEAASALALASGSDSAGDDEVGDG